MGSLRSASRSSTHASSPSPGPTVPQSRSHHSLSRSHDHVSRDHIVAEADELIARKLSERTEPGSGGEHPHRRASLIASPSVVNQLMGLEKQALERSFEAPSSSHDHHDPHHDPVVPHEQYTESSLQAMAAKNPELALKLSEVQARRASLHNTHHDEHHYGERMPHLAELDVSHTHDMSPRRGDVSARSVRSNATGRGMSERHLDVSSRREQPSRAKDLSLSKLQQQGKLGTSPAQVRAKDQVRMQTLQQHLRETGVDTYTLDELIVREHVGAEAGGGGDDDGLGGGGGGGGGKTKRSRRQSSRVMGRTNSRRTGFDSAYDDSGEYSDFISDGYSYYSYEGGHAEMSPEAREAALELSASYILDAIHGRPPKLTRTSHRQMLVYRIQHHWLWSWLLYLLVVLQMLLVLGEKSQTSSAERDLNLLFVELVCIFVYGVDLAMELYHSGTARFFQPPSLMNKAKEEAAGKHGSAKTPWYKSGPCGWLASKFSSSRLSGLSRVSWVLVQSGIVLVIMVDVLVHIFINRIPFFRVSRLLRSLQLFRAKVLRKNFVVLIKTVPALIDVLLMTTLMVIFFAVVGAELFKGSYTDPETGVRPDSHFDTVQDGMLSLYVLLTTENFPDVMYPSFRLNEGFVIFFVVFIFFGVFMLLSVAVAVIFDSFKVQRKKQALEDRIMERQALLAAFQCLPKTANNSVSFETWCDLIRSLKVEREEHEIQLLFSVIDQDGNGTVDVLEFFELVDCLLLRFEIEASGDSAWRTHPLTSWLYVARPKLQWLVTHKVFLNTVTVLIAFNIFVSASIPNSAEGSRERSVYVAMDYAILFLSCVELLLRMAAWGFIPFLHSGWNRFDFILVFVALASGLSPATPVVGIKLRSFRSIRMWRILTCIPRFKQFTNTFLKIGTPLSIVGGLLVIIFYVYAIFGMEVFGDTLDELPGYTSEVNEWATFSTPGRTFLLLFQLLTTSNFHDIMFATMTATNTRWASLYFVSFTFIVSNIVVNVLVSLVLEIFLLARETSLLVHSEVPVAGETPSRGSPDASAEDREEGGGGQMSPHPVARLGSPGYVATSTSSVAGTYRAGGGGGRSDGDESDGGGGGGGGGGGEPPGRSIRILQKQRYSRFIVSKDMENAASSLDMTMYDSLTPPTTMGDGSGKSGRRHRSISSASKNKHGRHVQRARALSSVHERPPSRSSSSSSSSSSSVSTSSYSGVRETVGVRRAPKPPTSAPPTNA